jgi:hypothetical protein
MSICLLLYSPCGPWRFYRILIYTQWAKLNGREISQSQGLYIHTGKYKEVKRTQIPMLRVGFEPTIPVSERVKTVHVVDLAGSVIICVHWLQYWTKNNTEFKQIIYTYVIKNESERQSEQHPKALHTAHKSIRQPWLQRSLGGLRRTFHNIFGFKDHDSKLLKHK